MARQSPEISPTVSVHSSKTHSQVHTPCSSIPSTPSIPDRPPSPEKKALHDSNAFLTALAAQERRVLELKEELQRAEANLEMLKKQWAVHETTKKRNELRQVEPLQPISAPPPGPSPFEDYEPLKVSQEPQRRKLRSLTTRQPQRTVFSGSRHTKTLSLLSEKTPAGGQTCAPRSSASAEIRRCTANRPTKSNTVPELSNAPKPPRPRQSLQDPSKDPMLDAGKQLVGDFKDGLWTFFEDLRQATIGEEIDTTNGNTTRKVAIDFNTAVVGKAKVAKRDSAGRSQFPARRSSLCEGPKHLKNQVASDSMTSPRSAFREEHPVEPSSKPKHQRTLTIETTNTDPDCWDTWDSPPRDVSLLNSSASSDNTDLVASPITNQSSPCTSLR